MKEEKIAKRIPTTNTQLLVQTVEVLTTTHDDDDDDEDNDDDDDKDDNNDDDDGLIEINRMRFFLSYMWTTGFSF